MPNYLILCLTVLLTLGACTTHQQVMRSSDPEYKYLKTKEYYDKKQYYSAIALLDELMSVYKGTKRAEELYWMYCNSHFAQKNYLLASFHYKAFAKAFPNNPNVETAMFQHAVCYHRMSPKSSLEQSFTTRAIDAYQLFVNTFPTSERVDACNIAVDDLHRKLELKAIESADLYYSTQKYRAASIAFKNVLTAYPDIAEAEDLLFKAVESQYKFAENSFASKQSERYEDALEMINTFRARYPKNEAYVPVLKDLEQKSHLGAITAQSNYAQQIKLEKKAATYELVKNAHKKHFDAIESNRMKKMANEALEAAYFETIRSHFQLAQLSKKSNKASHYDRVISNYYKFVDQFKESKFSKDAERLFISASDNLKKLNNEQN